ncbi:MAG: matrixin family metalloprotease [Planctomycetales bacterium]|nr:matrixin family metalloprotease [Planctomycetales bacterium]
MLFATFGGDAVWPFTELSYSYSNLLDNAILPTNQVITAVEEAMGIWSAYTPLRFFEQADSGQNVNDLDGDDDDNYEPERHALIRWGHHPIDGPGPGTVAHAYPPQDDGRGGDIHFDRQNAFDANGFLETAVHELGHALGLAHPNGDTKDGVCPPPFDAVMHACLGGGGRWSFNGLGTSRLLPDDINGIRSLYGSGLGYVLNLGGVLSIYGTDGNDELTVSVQNGVITGRTGDGRSFTRVVAGVNAINVHGLDGYDTLRVAENDGSIPVFLFGEGFDDRCEIRASNMNWRTSAGRVTCWSGNGYDKAYIYDVGATESRDYNFNGGSGPGVEIAGSPHRLVYDQSVEEVHLITGNYADRVFVWDTNSTTHAFVNNAGGHDNIFVGNAYRLQDIRGRFTVGFPEDIATPGAFSLHLNDGANLNSPNATVATGNWSDSTGITGAAPALISWFNRPDSFVYYTTGENRSDIKIEANFTWLKLFSSGGNDRIRIGGPFGLDRITGPISFDNGNPEITIDDSVQLGGRKNRVIQVNDHLDVYQAIWGMAPAPIFYQQPNQVLLLLGPGNDELNLNDHLVSEFIAFDTGGNDTFRVNGINSAYIDVPGGLLGLRTRHHRLSLAGDLASPDSLIINDQSRIDRINYSFTSGRIESRNLDFPLGEGLIVEYANMKNTDLIANDRDNEVEVFFTPTGNSQSTFQLGGGDDYFQVFPRDETGKSTINSNIGVFGNSGIDSFYVDDRFSEFGAKWAIDNRFGPNNQTVTVANSAAITAFHDVEYIFPIGSQGDDIFSVESFQSGNQMTILSNDGNDRLNVSPSSHDVAETITNISYFGFDAGAGHDGIWFNNQNAAGEWRYEENNRGLYVERTAPNYFITIDLGSTEYIHAEGGAAVPLIIGEVPPDPVVPPPIDDVFAAIREGIHDQEFDLNLDGMVDEADARFLIHDLLMTDYGDANLDRVFDSSDLIRIFQAGEYEDSVSGNSTWSEGDWNGDGDFDSADLVAAFQAGWYEVGLAVRANPSLRVSKPVIAREATIHIG